MFPAAIVATSDKLCIRLTDILSDLAHLDAFQPFNPLLPCPLTDQLQIIASKWNLTSTPLAAYSAWHLVAAHVSFHHFPCAVQAVPMRADTRSHHLQPHEQHSLSLLHTCVSMEMLSVVQAPCHVKVHAACSVIYSLVMSINNSCGDMHLCCSTTCGMLGTSQVT